MVTPQQLKALALLVADGHHEGENLKVRTLTADNQAGEYKPLGKALKHGDAFFVSVAPDILAVDFDSSDGVKKAQAFERDERLTNAVIIRSGGPGRAHLFARVDPKTREALEKKARLPLYGADARRSIRPPLSPHRNGLPVSLVNLTPEKAIERLSAQPVDEVSHRLEHGWPLRERSGGLFWLAIQYKLKGLTLEDYSRDVLANPQGAGAKLYEKQPQERQPYLKMTWNRAKSGERQHHREQLEHEAQNWKTVADEFYKVERGAILAVVNDLVEKALERTSLTFDKSVRDFTVGRSTAQRHLQKLKQDGFIVVRASPQTDDDQPPKANTYTLQIPESAQLLGHIKQHLIGGRVNHVSQFFRENREILLAIGLHSAFRTWETLRERGHLTVKEIAATRQRGTRAVQLQLQKLERFGLVERLEDGKYRAILLNEDQIELLRFELGTEEREQKKLERIAKERQAWRDLQEKARASGVSVKALLSNSITEILRGCSHYDPPARREPYQRRTAYARTDSSKADEPYTLAPCT